MSKTVFMSRTVQEAGYYELEFNALGIHLTQILPDEINYIPYTHYAYMDKNEYIEGSDFNNWVKKRPEKTAHTCQLVEYQGFSDSYKYCKICDKREYGN